MFEIRHYVTPSGRDLFDEWLRQLRDQKGKIAVIRRLNRLALGQYGDFKFLKDGVYELRLNTGPGYRIYFARSGDTVILLLCAGEKSSQSRDIEKACRYWLEWQKIQLPPKQ